MAPLDNLLLFTSLLYSLCPGSAFLLDPFKPIAELVMTIGVVATFVSSLGPPGFELPGWVLR